MINDLIAIFIIFTVVIHVILAIGHIVVDKTFYSTETLSEGIVLFVGTAVIVFFIVLGVYLTTVAVTQLIN